MFVEQIAVFVENRKGRILELTEVLEKNGIDLITLSIADTHDFGILRAMTRDNAKAVKALKAAGFTVTTNKLLGVEVPDHPGGLRSVLKVLDAENISVEYLYSFTHFSNGRAVILFRVEDYQKAIAALEKANVKLLEDNILG